MAPTPDRSSPGTALDVPAPCQPRIVPASVSNRNGARTGVPAGPGTMKPGFVLATVPVGAPGTLTACGAGGAGDTPAPVYRVVRSVPLSDTHHGLVAVRLRPHALTRRGSARPPAAPSSDTSTVTS